jgi:hypothetical protein
MTAKFTKAAHVTQPKYSSNGAFASQYSPELSHLGIREFIRNNETASIRIITKQTATWA